MFDVEILTRVGEARGHRHLRRHVEDGLPASLTAARKPIR